MRNIEQFRYITAAGLDKLVSRLIEDYTVFGTIKKDGFPAFSEITDVKELELAHTPTHLSAKEFLFPQRETLLKFDIRNNIHEAVIEAKEQVIIGLHSCDIHAIALMDRVFAEGRPDANYLARRNKTIIIGSDCVPHNFCFCKSMGTMNAEEGFDLFLHKVKNGYLVRVGSKKGGRLLSRYTATLRPMAAKFKELDEFMKIREASFVAKLDAGVEELPSIYEGTYESPVWDKIGAICTGCGSCNNVCPTCYCFDIRDEVRPNLREGERVRVWDGCTLEDFAKVAGGHNFRKTRAERLRHRFNRKFRYLSDRFGELFCVGCGRCSRTCLVKINIVEVTNEIIRESKRAGRK